MLRSNFCEYLKCGKAYINSIFCNKCFKKFCTNTCLNKHIKEVHQQPDKKQPEKQITFDNIKDETTSINNEKELDIKDEEEVADSNQSIYIKKGIYLSDIVYDSYYDIANFEIKTNQTLGVGSFGEVFIGINRKDKAKFAIKRVIIKYFNDLD